jgi:hypothetical protein
MVWPDWVSEPLGSTDLLRQTPNGQIVPMALFFYGIGAIFYKIIDIHTSPVRLIPSLNFLKDAESSNSSPYFVGIEIIIKMDRVNIIIFLTSSTTSIK